MRRDAVEVRVFGLLVDGLKTVLLENRVDEVGVSDWRFGGVLDGLWGKSVLFGEGSTSEQVGGSFVGSMWLKLASQTEGLVESWMDFGRDALFGAVS